MRLDSVLDSVYVLGSLWGALTGSPVCAATPPAPAAAKMTAFVDVNVVPMDRERVLAHQTVLVEGERITALGPVGKITVPAGAVRVDGRGKYLMPGLGDMHMHAYALPPDGPERKRWQYDQISYLAMGVTGVRSLGEGYGDEMPKVRQYFATGDFPIPRIYLPRSVQLPVPAEAEQWAKRMAAAHAAGYDTLWIPRPVPPESLGAYVAAAKAAGYDHIVAPDEFRSPQDQVFFDSLAAAARRAGLPVAIHSEGGTDGITLEVALALGAAGGSIEHMSTVSSFLAGPEQRETTNRQPAATLPRLREVAAALARAGVWVNPTAECMRRSGAIPDAQEWLKTLYHAGVSILFSGDQRVGMREELLAMVERAGLSPYEVLLIGTRNVARYFRREHDLGTVAVGKLADLVLLYGNPLSDISHMWEPAGVMVNGRWLDRGTLDQHIFAAAVGPGVHEVRSPWHWIAARVKELVPGHGRKIRGGVYPMTETQATQFLARHATLVALGDSLAAVPAAEQAAAGRLRQRIAAEFGTMHALLTPAQRTMFDPLVHMWLREEVRQGHRLTVPGVRPPDPPADGARRPAARPLIHARGLRSAVGTATRCGGGYPVAVPGLNQ